ncbi:Lar family restriction alleviation protein [Salinisphaera sp. T31B1]|uniref:Lar family restriction alleviation protein n=1 Tax=Salinisphaera sp. T31B1 TaxID=727963 RepID=UPI00333E1ADD
MSHQTECETMLPCPFCGGPPCAVVMNETTSRAVRDEDWGEDGVLFISAHVFCHECGARGEAFQEPIALPPELPVLKERAAKAWNDRNARHLGLYVASVRGA